MNFAEEKDPNDMSIEEAGTEYERLWNSPAPGEAESVEARGKRLEKMNVLWKISHPTTIDKDIDFQLSGSSNPNLYHGLYDSYGGEQKVQEAIDQAAEALDDHITEEAMQKSVKVITDKLGEEEGLEAIENAKLAAKKYFSSKDMEFLETSKLGNDVELIQALSKVGEIMQLRKDRRQSKKEDKGIGKGTTYLTGFREDNSPEGREQAISEIAVIMASPRHPMWDLKHPGHKAAVEEWERLHKIAYGKD